MPRFRILEHTADARIAAYGQDLGEAFANAAYGMFSLIADLDSVAEVSDREVEVEAPDIEALLVAWLNELLYLFDAQQFLPRRVQVLDVSDTRLQATLSGETVDLARHRLRTAVKAATYHDILVETKDGRARVRVTFDL